MGRGTECIILFSSFPSYSILHFFFCTRTTRQFAHVIAHAHLPVIVRVSAFASMETSFSHHTITFVRSRDLLSPGEGLTSGDSHKADAAVKISSKIRGVCHVGSADCPLAGQEL